MKKIETDAQTVRQLIERSIEVKRALLAGDQVERLAEIARVCTAALTTGGKVLLCGNGGSAADAQHLAAELLVRLRSEVDRRPLPALALALDSSSLTACGNDYDFETYFERMVQALGNRGDVLIGITTSGKSPNVRRALRAARSMAMTAVGFLGGDGGPALGDCDLAVVVPSYETGRVQECHIMLGHALMELIEDSLRDHGCLNVR